MGTSIADVDFGSSQLMVGGQSILNNLILFVPEPQANRILVGLGLTVDLH